MKNKAKFKFSKAIAEFFMILTMFCFMAQVNCLFAQDVQEGDTLDPQALSGAVSFVSDTYNSATNYISSFFSVAEPVQPAIETESVSTGLIVPADSLAAMGIAADAAQVDNYPVSQTPPQGDLGADALFTLSIPEYRIPEVPIQLPDRLPEPEGYRPPMPAVRQPAPATPIDLFESIPPASDANALAAMTFQSDQLPAPSTDMPQEPIARQQPAVAEQPPVTPEYNEMPTPSANMSGGPAVKTKDVFKPDVVLGPGFNTPRSSSELYYFNRMIQKLPPEERARVASHANYMHWRDDLPISTRRHLGIPVDEAKITREQANGLYIEKELAGDVTQRFYSKPNQEYRDSQDRLNTYNGYNNVN